MINENSVTEIHQGKRIEAKSGPESATGGTSSCASYFCLSLLLSPTFLSLSSSSPVGVPGILMIHA